MADLNVRGALRGLAGGAADFVLFDAETERQQTLERMRQRGQTARNRERISSTEDIAASRLRARVSEGGLDRTARSNVQTQREEAAMARTLVQQEGLDRRGRAESGRRAQTQALSLQKEKRLRATSIGRLVASMYQGIYDEQTGSFTIEDAKRPEANRVFVSSNTIAEENPGLLISDAIAIARMLEGTSTSGPASLTRKGQQVWNAKYKDRGPTQPIRQEPAREQETSGMAAVKDLLGF